MDSSDEENVMPVERKTPSPPPRPVEDLSTNDICLRFECPENFQEISTAERSQVHLADVADNKELWLIRVPNNFDSSSIDDVVLNLKSRTQFSCEGKKYQAITKKLKKNQVKGATEVLLPNELGVLCSGPRFKGHVTVIEVPDIPDIKIPASPPSPKIELPTGMRERFQPFGCGKTDTTPGKQKKKKKKKKKMKSLDQSDKFEATFSVKSEEETDSSFANFSQSTPTDEEDRKPFAVKRRATDLSDSGAPNIKKKKKKVKKEKR